LKPVSAETVIQDQPVRCVVSPTSPAISPGSDPPWVAPLRPDLLADQLLATCPQLSDLILTGYGHISAPGQLEQLLSELTRAQARAPVHAALGQLLTAQLPGLLAAATDAPTGLLPGLLDLALTRCPSPPRPRQISFPSTAPVSLRLLSQ
jgi:hypothetical protein